MRRLLFFAGVGLLLVTGALPAAAQGRNDDRVCFYKDVQFRGDEWCYRPGDEVADLRNRADQISSVRIFGRARVQVFADREFRGASDAFDRDVPDLNRLSMEGRRSWNDRIESFMIADDRGRRGGPFADRDRRDNDDRFDDRNADRRGGRDRVCVYEGANYRGRSQCWDAGEEESNLNRTNGWNDAIASVRVFGQTSFEVYRDANFKGQRFLITRDVPDLGALNWGSQISSFRVRN